MHVYMSNLLNHRRHPLSESVTWSLNAETTRNLGDTPSVLAAKQKSERREPARRRSTERDMEVDGVEEDEARPVKAEEEEVRAATYRPSWHTCVLFDVYP